MTRTEKTGRNLFPRSRNQDDEFRTRRPAVAAKDTGRIVNPRLSALQEKGIIGAGRDAHPAPLAEPLHDPQLPALLFQKLPDRFVRLAAGDQSEVCLDLLLGQ